MNLDEIEKTPVREPKAPGWPALAFEVFSIVLGVLLALAVSEWAEDRENRRLADAALVNIANEVDANFETLTLIHDNNTATLHILSTQPDGGESDSRSIIPGIQLRDTAWQAFLATGLSAHVDYDDMLRLSATYSMQDVYRRTGMQLAESGMNAAAFAAALGKEIDNALLQGQFVGYFELLVQIETQLLNQYCAAPVPPSGCVGSIQN